ncbi:MAG TPA: DUF378 domain-containing protein [Patescibacteria group bacterium]|jgi:hypothetical protein
MQMLAYYLMVIGALNWGLVGLFDWNLVEMLLGSWPSLVTLVYVLVGLSALYHWWTNKAKMMK